MNSKFNEYTDEEHKMYNGQTVMSVLSNLGDAASADSICDEIGHLCNQPRDVVEPEVKRILRRGISSGFLVKFGKNYLLSGEQSAVEVDSKRKTYTNMGKRDKRKRSIKSVETISDQRDGDYLIMSRNLVLKPDETDIIEKSNKLVLLNPREVVNGIINDLYNMVNPSEQTSDEQENVIDLEAILSKNLNTLSMPIDDMPSVD